MTALRQFMEWIALRRVDSDLARAQFVELRRQIPLLYALLAVNAVAVAWTHFDVAPRAMTLLMPSLLILAAVSRMAIWLRRRHFAVAGKAAITTLRNTTIFASLIAVAYIAWSLSLWHYGDLLQQAHVSIFISITVIGCIFCLMHLPQAALIVTSVVAVPYLLYSFTTYNEIFVAIGINIVLVMLVMFRVLMNSFGGFQALIHTKGEAERLHREVTKLAHTDMLTGLPNRRLFFAEVERVLDEQRASGGEVALGVIDLDRFKAANDTFGHIMGDRLLEAVGARLAGVFGEGQVVARLGGDEFAFVLAGDGEAAMRVAGQACAAISPPFRLGDVSVSIGASCGVATSTDVAATAAALYDGADYALYKAKSGRRGFPTLYSAEHERRVRSERAVEAALQTADLDAEMDVHFHPIVAVRGNEVQAVEALARWNSATLGRVGPDVFIPLAERAGIIHRMTLILLEKALAGLRQMPGGVRLSFNLSAHDMTCHETVLSVVALIRRSGLAPGRITMELTETAVVRDFEAAETSMRLLRSLGVGIALDDFGTGQSSLSYLSRLPIDKVKLDRSFMPGPEDKRGQELLAAVVTFCKSMRIECIAEGVEDENHLGFLRAIGCDSYQGYLLAKPMAIGDFLSWHAGRSLRGPQKATG